MKIGVAASGGVDSSVTMALLQREGYEVEAWHMLTQQSTPDPALQATCDRLGVPLHLVDLREDFEREVVAPFFEAYAHGRTPNPCAWCNPRLKFGRLMEAIGGLMATGHYVGKAIEPRTGVTTIQCANDTAKDQSYFLYALTPEQLERVRFPLAHKTRAEVVALARELQLPIPEARLASGSQDICFLPEGDYRPELCRRHPECIRPGNILDPQGKILGKHTGLGNYTRGQRRGIGVATGGRAFVVDFDRAANTLTLGPKEALERMSFHVTDCHWLVPPTYPLHCQAVSRYHHPAFECSLAEDGTVSMPAPQTLLTPGQCCVFYHDNFLLGGGVIDAC